jgi:hypothetical protein
MEFPLVNSKRTSLVNVSTLCKLRTTWVVKCLQLLLFFSNCVSYRKMNRKGSNLYQRRVHFADDDSKSPAGPEQRTVDVGG